MTAATVRRNALAVIWAAMGLAMAMPALAIGNSSAGTSSLVEPGTLDITRIDVGNFAGRRIIGQKQVMTATLGGYSVTDLRGTGAGWQLTAQADRFVDGGEWLAHGSLTMSQPTVAADGTDSPAPTVGAGPAFTLDVAAPVRIATAAQDAGMGTYDFGAAELTLRLPADVRAGAYTSTLTFTVATAP